MKPESMIFASDSFKGSLSQEQILSLLEFSAAKHFPDCTCVSLPIADGGEGTAEAVVRAAGGELRKVKVHGPLMEEREACYGLLPHGRAIIEMAQASGLPLVPEEQRDPRNTTTYGTGELILDALRQGCRDIRIALGGSATNDGGMGCLRALGFRFLDKDGNELEGYGRDLAKVSHISLSQVKRRVHAASFTVMCDVDNPLCGKDGATYIFGPQKGATPEILEELEAGMQNYARCAEAALGENYAGVSGAGAAGGLGFAAAAFLRGQMRSGIETVLDLIQFDRMLMEAGCVITGEGRMDGQSTRGKAVYGIAEHCKKEGVPCYAIVGSLGEGAEKMYRHGVTDVVVTAPEGMDLADAMANAESLYRKAADRLFEQIERKPL